MRKRFVVAVLAVLALAWARPTTAETIAFDVDGSGGGSDVINATKFDWLPGNSLLIENGDGTATVLFQANLGSIVATPLSDSYLNGSNDVYYTAVASFDVTLTATGFTINSGGTFAIYADSSPADDLAGTGFTGGTVILTGTAVSGSGSLIPTGDITTLDQFEGDSYSGLQSIVGTGGFSVTVQVLTTDANYFLQSPDQIIVSSISSGSNNLPFTQVDPSALFTDIGNGGAVVTGATAVGAVNGLCIDSSTITDQNPTGDVGSLDPCKIIAESDASSTFATVPEPASLTLLGLGLAGSAAARRRMQKKAKQQA